MRPVGRDMSCVLPDGRALEYWDGGDPAGRPVIFHPGTPASRILGRWGHDAAVAARIRLVAVSRPGYGGSTPAPPSLLATGHDTATLAAALDLGSYAVVGVSGGGPFAVATAVADPDAVRAVVVLGGVGPWRELDEPDAEDQEHRRCLALHDTGDEAGAAGLRRLVEEDLSRLVGLDQDARVDTVLGETGGPTSPLTRDHEYRSLWAANLALVLQGPDGNVFDELSWGGTWDVDPSDVVAPTLVWDAEGPGGLHGQWYAERIEGAELVLLPGEGHVHVCDGHWPDVLAGVLRVWPPASPSAGASRAAH